MDQFYSQSLETVQILNFPFPQIDNRLLKYNWQGHSETSR